MLYKKALTTPEKLNSFPFNQTGDQKIQYPTIISRFCSDTALWKIYLKITKHKYIH